MKYETMMPYTNSAAMLTCGAFSTKNQQTRKMMLLCKNFHTGASYALER